MLGERGVANLAPAVAGETQLTVVVVAPDVNIAIQYT